ncbi:MAG: GNAT family N-acetyltransferase [Chryseobacterium sp.]|nr:GNAT family N-acetyltransferase [Chryseobacterium sp.]
MMIIKATEKDIPTIQDLAKRSWNFAYANILQQEQIDYMLDLMYSDDAIGIQLENPNFQYYLIKEDGLFSGFIGFEFHQEPETTKLHRIYFLRGAQGKGFGKKALEFVINEAKKANDIRVTLTVNKNNQAQNFYRSQGFKIYDEAIFDIGNGYVMDDYLMEYIINKNNV